MDPDDYSCPCGCGHDRECSLGKMIQDDMWVYLVILKNGMAILCRGASNDGPERITLWLADEHLKSWLANDRRIPQIEIWSPNSWFRDRGVSVRRDFIAIVLDADT